MSVQPLEMFTPYSTVSPMFTATPQWMTPEDAQRIMAYEVYEQIFWNVPETFKLTARGTEDKPIYVPTGKTIVNTTNRYIGKDWAPSINKDIGTSGDQQALTLALSDLFVREKFYGQFTSNKRYGLIRGDWLWHIIGNDLKPQGTRLKIQAVDPAAYFPVSHPDDPDKIIACYIVEQIQDPKSKEWVLKRQTYQKGLDPINNDGSDTTIYNSVATFKAEDWEDLSGKAVQVIKPLTPLPPDITALPVYHLKNIETPGDPFGSSELRGLERIMAAVNQAVSDEELALALDGLGMYATDSGAPVDDKGNPIDWVLGPGRVVEIGNGKKFERVSGVGDVKPVQDHLAFLIQQLKEASDTPDIAIGKVEVAQVSGISLMLQMGPMLSKADERDETIAGTMDQFLYDITTMWLPAYEGQSFNARVVSSFGDRLPTDRAARLQEIVQIASMPGVVDTLWIHSELAKLGFQFTDTTAANAMNELAARAAAIDPFSARLTEEEQQ